MNIDLHKMKQVLEDLKAKKAQIQGQRIELDNQRKALEQEFIAQNVTVETLDPTIANIESELVSAKAQLDQVLQELNINVV